MWSRLGKGYPPQLELVSVFLLLGAFYLVYRYYPDLPARIPIHFNTSGVPDGWGGRAEIFIYPVVGTAIALMLTGITFGIAAVKDPNKMINLPSVLSRDTAESVRVVVIRGIFAMKLVMQGMFVYLLWSNIQVALGKATGTGSVWLIFLAAILGITGYITFAALRAALADKPSASPPAPRPF